MIDVCDWLKACETCGKVHELRKPRGHTHKPGQQCRCVGTFADPDDGHLYRPRMNDGKVDQLKREYERTQL